MHAAVLSGPSGPEQLRASPAYGLDGLPIEERDDCVVLPEYRMQLSVHAVSARLWRKETDDGREIPDVVRLFAWD